MNPFLSSVSSEHALVPTENMKSTPRGVPEEFPGTVSLIYDVTGTADTTIQLHDEYRRYKNGKDDNFDWFVLNVMDSIQPRKSKIRECRDNKLISEIFTVSDEAFALMMLLNELHVWKDEVNGKGKGKRIFTDKSSGRKQGWDSSGLVVYNELCWLVADRRKEEASRNYEEAFRRRYSTEIQQLTPNMMVRGNGEIVNTVTLRGIEALKAKGRPEWGSEEERQIMDNEVAKEQNATDIFEAV